MNAKNWKFVIKVIRTGIMLALSAVMVLPFVWMLSASLKPNSETFLFPVKWIPSPVTFEHYLTIWNNQFYIYFWNSIYITTICVGGVVITSALAGYSFAKIRFRGRELVFLLYIATLLFPDQMLLIPRFVLYRMWGLYNTPWALVLPGIFTAFGTFLFRQFFITVPDELLEAARIDGYGHFRIFYRVVLPLSMPVVSTLIILTFVSVWNNYENPLAFISRRELYTIPLGLRMFKEDMRADNGAMMAAASASLVPIFAVFLSLQRNFIEGIASSGIKM